MPSPTLALDYCHAMPTRRLRAVSLAVTGILFVLAVALAAWRWTPDIPRARLEARYFTGASAWLEVEGLRLHVRDTDPRAAPAVILLHGFGASLHTWKPWAQGLAATHRVVRYDQPGGGLTDPDPSGDYTDRRGLRVLAGLMDRLGIRRASLVSNSIGGRLAWRFAAEYLDRVERLVLIAPDGFASPGFEYGRAAQVPAVFGLMRHALPRAALRMSLAPAYGDPARLSQDVLTRYYELTPGPGVRGAALERLVQTVLEPPDRWLRAIRTPTLLVWGEKDAVIPAAHARDYLERIAGSTLVIFPGLGHVPHEEAPAAALPPVRDFLADR